MSLRPVGDTTGMSFEVVTAADRPDLRDAARVAFRAQWRGFMFHDELATQYTPRIDSHFREFHVFLR